MRVVGDGTERIAALRPGTRVAFEGPYGTLTGAQRTRPGMLMIGAGAGVAPLTALLEGEQFAPGEAILVTRDHSEQERMRTDAIHRLVRDRGLIHYALDGRRAPGAGGWLPATHSGWSGADLLRFVAPDIAERDVFLCGPGPWMDSLRADLRRAGVPADRIHDESFTI